MIRQFHRNESSWNVRSRGTKVPRERMFHGTKVLGTFAPEERKFQGANVPWNESSTGAKVSMVFSLPGTKVQRNEKAWNHFLLPNTHLNLSDHFRRRTVGIFFLVSVVIHKYRHLYISLSNQDLTKCLTQNNQLVMG